MVISILVLLLVSVGVVTAGSEGYGFAVDIGSEWIKVCVVSPTASSIGSYVDIAINEQSNRKTPAMVAFASADEVLIGEEALSLFYKSPSSSFPHLKQLALGLTGADPNADADAMSVKNSLSRWSAHFQAYNYNVKLRQTDDFIEFALPSKTAAYDVPTLYSLFYSYSQQLASKHASTSLIDPSSSSSTTSSSESETSIRRAVVLYPSFFDAEQVAFHKQLATVSGLNVVSMLDELMAVAIDYGVRHTASLSSSSPTPLIIWNGGANSITASLFQLSFNPAQNELTIHQLFSSSSPSIGGIDIDLAVRDHLAATFDRTVLKLDTKNNDNVHKNSIVTHPRAMSKLLREARDLKEQLTVSPVAILQIEELFGGRDFSYTLTKETLDELLTPMLSSFLHPLQQAVEFARREAGMKDLPQVELYGGSLRVRGILTAAEQQVLNKQSVGRHIDGEEAAVLGAAHYLAVLNGANVIKLQLSNRTLFSHSKHQVLSSSQLSSISSSLSSLSALSARRAAVARLKNQLESLTFRANELLSSSSVAKSSSAHNKEQLQQQVEAARSVLEDAEFGTVDEERLASVTNALSASVKAVEAAVPKPTASKEEDITPRKPRHRSKRPSPSSSTASSKPSTSHQSDKKKEESKKPAAKPKPSPKPQPKTHKPTKEEL